MRYLLLGLLLFPTTASAAPIIYTDVASFNAMVGPTDSVNFDNPPTNVDYNPASNYLKLTYDNLVVFGSDASGGSLPQSGGIQLDGNGGNIETLEAITGFGFDIRFFWELSRIRIWGVGDPYREIGQPTIGYDVPDGATFFGVLFDEPTKIIITSDVGNASGVNGYLMDNLRLRRVNVPEPSTLLLFSLGLLLYPQRAPKGRNRRLSFRRSALERMRIGERLPRG
jgi:hypothetical protein